jgi:GT2 family glycosyltransferase
LRAGRLSIQQLEGESVSQTDHLDDFNGPSTDVRSATPVARTPEIAVINDFTPACRGLRRVPAAAPELPLISILVLTLDGRTLLDRLFASFAAVNTYPNIEFIVVDHGSTDSTIELLRDWARRLPVKVLARGANFSFSQSNNKAARLASGSLLLLLNNDVVFAEDCLAGMAGALADPKVGAVGLKQYQGLPSSPEPRRVYHLGVRFGWNLVERRLRPHHVRPSALDAHVMQAVAAFPAVTASALLCRRIDYLAVGGLSEAYVYGLEDVDFCCKIRGRLGKEVVCYNHAFAFHPKNATRDRDAAGRRPLEKQNRRVLQARCGYVIRRDFLTSRFGDDGSMTGRPFTIGLATPLDSERSIEGRAAVALGNRLRDRFGWKVVHLDRQTWSDAADLDVYVSMTPGADIAGLSRADPHLVTVCWLMGSAEPWLARPSFDRFHLRLCAREEVRAQLAERFGHAEALHENLDGQVERFSEALAQAFGHWRVALKIAAGADQITRATNLKRALIARRRLARIDPPDEWYGPASLADDVVLALDASYRPAADQINVRMIRASPEARSGDWDAEVVKGGRRPTKPGAVQLTVLPARISLDEEVQALVSRIEALHQMRLARPCDPPLADPREAVEEVSRPYADAFGQAEISATREIVNDG